ncbi:MULTISPECIES: YopX family protein [Bacillus]|uniref:YopX family protein n=1 Tax=Bacillus TaxID=1386 RepID=UPI0011960D03|nr:YopX family protein [Bacillus subtilis]MBO3634415.1 hypothetical protein [Bacillus subtilis]QGH99573.1 hypothetical protein GII77_03440 [Bacillus subtilis]TVX87619.1 hypothetical protein FQP35_11675 [Bacillus subtilis]
MREIKFRAYHTEKRDGQEFPRMMDWDEILNNDEEELASYFRNEFSNVSPLMQYTGLKDKNGRDIYEGDVVKFKSAYCENKIIKAVVKFKDSLGSFVFNMGDDQGFWRMDASIREIEVIGNIYEDPELLEASHASK